MKWYGIGYLQKRGTDAFLGRKALRLFLLLALVMCIMPGCGRTEELTEDNRLRVVTTIFPPYDFVRQVAGDKVQIKMLLKPGEESHSYEPTPQDIIAIQKSDLFIYVGGENDAWVEEILSSLDQSDLKTLRLVDCVDTVAEEHIDGMKVERGHSDEVETDEHVWTSPQNAIVIVNRIGEVLESLDGNHLEIYRGNRKQYIEKLEKLNQQFREITSQAPRKTLIFGDRFPFRYFADAYGLSYYAAFPGCASDTEPSAATMAFLINMVEKEKVPVILKMELSNENISKAIAESTNTKVKTFYSCHNLTARQLEKGETYLSLMEKNVETLKEALHYGTD